MTTTPTPTRARRALVRLAGASLGLLAGLLAMGLVALLLAPWAVQSPGRAATLAALWLLPLVGLLEGVHRANKRLEHPKPRRRLAPGSERPNRLIRHG
jgi:uncharacterized membrane protein